jgi:hypothetical protein
VRNRVLKIKFQWKSLVSVMNLNEAGNPPAFFLLADVNHHFVTDRKDLERDLKAT